MKDWQFADIQSILSLSEHSNSATSACAHCSRKNKLQSLTEGCHMGTNTPENRKIHILKHFQALRKSVLIS